MASEVSSCVVSSEADEHVVLFRGGTHFATANASKEQSDQALLLFHFHSLTSLCSNMFSQPVFFLFPQVFNIILYYVDQCKFELKVIG